MDGIISVDLQRPGQGHEACFFDNLIPVESVFSGDIMAEAFLHRVKFDDSSKVVVVSATPQCVKKARRFQKHFKESLKKPIGFSVFVRSAIHSADEFDIATGKLKQSLSSRTSDLFGDVKGCDVVIVDEVVGKCFLVCRLALYM